MVSATALAAAVTPEEKVATLFEDQKRVPSGQPLINEEVENRTVRICTRLFKIRPMQHRLTERSTNHSGLIRLMIYLALIGAVCLRFYHLDSQSLWLDEIWTLEISCGHDGDHQLLPVNQLLDHPPDLTSLAAATPPWRVWTSMDRVTGPPGYYLLLRVWMSLFGQSEATVRSLSAILSLVALVIFFQAIRDSIGTEAAAWFCILTAVAGPQIHYAQDARPYALMLAEAAGAVWATLKISAEGPTAFRSATLILTSLLLVLTHYFAISVLLAIGGYGLIRTAGSKRRTILGCLIASMIIFLLIWGPFMWRQLPRFSTSDRAAAFLHEAGPDHLRLTFWRIVTLPMSLLADIRPIPRWYAVGGLWYVLLAVIGWRSSWIWPMLYLAVVGLLGALDLAHSTAHLAYVRYALLASPAVYGMLAASVCFHRLMGRILCGAVTVFCLIALPYHSLPPNEDFRDFGNTMLASVHPGDLIVFAGPAETYSPQILFLAASHYAGPLPGPVLLLESPATSQLMAKVKDRNQIWLAADPAVPSVRIWLPGFHIVSGKSWPVVGSLLEMQRD
jgi:hypothetical protein